MKPATLYKPLENKSVQCLACNHYCRILPGRTGICGVRQNKDGELYLLVYGKAVAVHVDPVEKKPLYHFLPGKKIFSIGTLGCNFGCAFCQNWQISQATKQFQAQVKAGEVELLGKVADYGQKLPPEEVVGYCKENNIPMIAYTYNEPAIFFEYAYDCAKLAKEFGIRNVFVSNGYSSKESLEKLKGVVDAFNIDLKAFTEEFYQKTCRARLAPVLETIKRVHKMGFWLEITTLIIPGMNDSSKELRAIANFVASVDPEIPWHVSAFHPDYKMIDIPHTPHETLLKAYDIGKKEGLKYIYMGNVYDPERESTYCPKCGKLLIRRVGYDVKIIALRKGKCAYCGQVIKGVWK